MELAPGTGPGVITPDGCAVDLYALLPPMGEPWIVHAAVPAGASVLELGAGPGGPGSRTSTWDGPSTPCCWPPS